MSLTGAGRICKLEAIFKVLRKGLCQLGFKSGDLLFTFEQPLNLGARIACARELP